MSGGRLKGLTGDGLVLPGAAGVIRKPESHFSTEVTRRNVGLRVLTIIRDKLDDELASSY